MPCHDVMLIVAAVNATYRPIFPIATSIINEGNGSRIIPATTVNGSPIIGNQLNKSDHFP